MKDYPQVSIFQLSFTATILGSILPIVEDQVYTLNSAPLSIYYEPFQVLPSDHNVGPSSIEAYIFKGEEYPSLLDFSCNCVAKVND